LCTQWQPAYKKLHTNVPAYNLRKRYSESNDYYLGKGNYVNTTGDRPEKKLCPHDINAGNNHHQQQPNNTYPLKSTTY